MRVNYGIRETRKFQLVREFDDETTGGMEHFGEFDNLKAAERAAKLLSESEPGSGWYTVPQTD